MEVQRRTLDTIDTVDRLLSAYAPQGPAPLVTLPRMSAPLQRPVTVTPAATLSTTTQTEKCVSTPKFTQTCTTTRNTGTNTTTTTMKAVGAQTEKDDRYDNAVTVLSQQIQEVEDHYERRLASLLECSEQAQDRVTVLKSEIEHYSQYCAAQKRSAEIAQRAELVSEESIIRQEIVAHQLSDRLHWMNSFYQKLVACALAKPPPSPKTDDVSPRQSLPSSSPSPPRSDPPNMTGATADPIALLLQECILVLGEE